MKGSRVYKHILVPTDGSKLSLKAAREAARLAAPLKARITALYVIPPFSPPSGGEGIAFRLQHVVREYEEGMRKQADEALAKVAAAAGRACERSAVVHPNPWEAIISSAKSRKCDLIVMASHGRRGLSALLLGSETQKVLTHSKTPVLVCR
jgi:nucleotide-binding universal stress UspA family protein